jgi:putative mRNA 3-end processing factor
MFSFEKDIKLLDSELWLDPGRVKQLAYVSHAHSDHAKNHKTILATPQTAEICRYRLKGKRKYIELPFGEKIEQDGYQIELRPAGHILGSAQIIVEKNGERLVYTGDFKLAHGLTCQPGTPIKTDILIMENTYGHPRYSFPDTAEIRENLRHAVVSVLDSGADVIIYAYSLGKAQEVLKIFEDIPKLVGPTVAPINEIYQSFGVDLGRWQVFDYSRPLKNELLITPPPFGRGPKPRTGSRIYRAFVSGWGIDSSTKFRMKVDEVFPLSDHADFEDLMAYVEQSDPGRILLTHGFDDVFARMLRERGYDAQPLEESRQTELFPN